MCIALLKGCKRQLVLRCILKKLCSYTRQEDTGLATTFSPVDVSANYCVVTGNHEVSPLYYGDVIAPQHHEVEY